MYVTAADSLGTLDQKTFGHWRVYCMLKSKFYLSYVSDNLFFIGAVCHQMIAIVVGVQLSRRKRLGLGQVRRGDPGIAGKPKE